MRMRLIAAVGLAVAAVLATASAAGAQTPTGDFVIGSGTASSGTGLSLTFTIDARSGPRGENATGHVTETDQRGTTLDGPVTCLAVNGNVAVVNVRGQTGAISTQMFVDQISPTDPDDGFILTTGGRAGDDCSPIQATEIVFSLRVDFGGIVVHDALPPPTAYPQCRQGGWVKFGFASHAACIDYVHEQARQKCIFERVAHGLTAFRAKYGLGANDDHAMRHCVRLYTGF